MAAIHPNLAVLAGRQTTGFLTFPTVSPVGKSNQLHWGASALRLNQVTVGATNFQESLAFYQTIGLRLIVSSRSEYARFELPDGEATLSIHLQTTVPRGGPIVYFEVDDVDDTFARLRKKGVAFEVEPIDQPWLWREARLIDPAGNEICLFKAGEHRRYPPWRLVPPSA